MKIRIASDLHCCMWGNKNVEGDLKDVLPHTEDDKKSVLCLAGDVGLYTSYKYNIEPYLVALSKRFKAVCYVPGNHEWYGSSDWFGENDFWKYRNLPKNVHVLIDDFVKIDGVVFIGSTLWTDFDNRNSVAMFHAESRMSDFECITKRIGDAFSRRISPEDTVDRHYNSKKFIFDTLKMFKDKKCVVITHHMPSGLCVTEKFRGDLLNYAFHSELGNDITELGKPNIWIAGHTHSTVNTIIGETQIIINPYGYMFKETNREYNPTLIVEI